MNLKEIPILNYLEKRKYKHPAIIFRKNGTRIQDKAKVTDLNKDTTEVEFWDMPGITMIPDPEDRILGANGEEGYFYLETGDKEYIPIAFDIVEALKDKIEGGESVKDEEGNVIKEEYGTIKDIRIFPGGVRALDIALEERRKQRTESEPGWFEQYGVPTMVIIGMIMTSAIFMYYNKQWMIQQKNMIQKALSQTAKTVANKTGTNVP